MWEDGMGGTDRVSLRLPGCWWEPNSPVPSVLQWQWWWDGEEQGWLPALKQEPSLSSGTMHSRGWSWQIPLGRRLSQRHATQPLNGKPLLTCLCISLIFHIMYFKSLISWGFFSSEHFIHYHLLLDAHRRVSHWRLTRLKSCNIFWPWVSLPG